MNHVDDRLIDALPTPGGHACVVCQKRPYERAYVCQTCRRHIAENVLEVGSLHGRLDEIVEPAAGMPGERVGGSSEPKLPINVDAIDLAAPARPASRALHARGVLGLDGCQVGHLSVATILDTWVRDWAEIRHETGPALWVAWQLATWLRDRVEWACDTHPAVDEFAAEMRDTASTLRGILGEPRGSVPEVCAGVACRRCAQRTLFHAEDYVECATCGRLYTGQEYEEILAQRGSRRVSAR